MTKLPIVFCPLSTFFVNCSRQCLGESPFPFSPHLAMPRAWALVWDECVSTGPDVIHAVWSRAQRCPFLCLLLAGPWAGVSDLHTSQNHIFSLCLLQYRGHTIPSTHSDAFQCLQHYLLLSQPPYAPGCTSVNRPGRLEFYCPYAPRCGHYINCKETQLAESSVLFVCGHAHSVIHA